MLTELELAAIPECLLGTCEDALNFPEAVYLARIELYLIEEGQDSVARLTKKEIKQIRKFVRDNRASLKSFSERGY